MSGSATVPALLHLPTQCSQRFPWYFPGEAFEQRAVTRQERDKRARPAPPSLAASQRSVTPSVRTGC
jgi:hypothetical protein